MTKYAASARREFVPDTDVDGFEIRPWHPTLQALRQYLALA
jgi:hypothetical protein